MPWGMPSLYHSASEHEKYMSLFKKTYALTYALHIYMSFFIHNVSYAMGYALLISVYNNNTH